MGFDYKTSADGTVLSHATSFAIHPGFRLCAGVDPDGEKRRLFVEKFNAPAFAALEEVPRSIPMDVVAVASPTRFHCEDVLAALQHDPTGILCEKPLALSTADAEKMIVQCKVANCLLGVNYIRRFEPGTLELKERIQNGAFGACCKGTVWYTKGLYNNASHFIDLLMFIFGAPVAQRVIRNNRFWQETDPEPDFVLTFPGEADVHFIALPSENFSLTEMHLAFSGGLVRYQRGGADLMVYSTVPDPVFTGYTTLDPDGQKIKTDFKRYQKYAVEAFYQALTTGRPMASTAVTALETLRVTDSIHKEVRSL